MKSVCVLHVLTVDAYQKIAKIADHQTIVQIVVGKSVAAGIILINSSLSTKHDNETRVQQ
jgi:hypothetical protein